MVYLPDKGTPTTEPPKKVRTDTGIAFNYHNCGCHQLMPAAASIGKGTWKASQVSIPTMGPAAAANSRWESEAMPLGVDGDLQRMTLMLKVMPPGKQTAR